MLSISVVIPIYNEKKNLIKLSKLIIKHVNLKRYEVIFVDDNSFDGSIEILKKLKKKNKKFRYILRKEKSRDLTKSCFLGFAKSSYNNILVMDGDLQHDPKDIKKLIYAYTKNKADIVVGSRNLFESENKGLSLMRINASKILILMVKYLLGEKTSDPMSGFFLFKKQLLKKTKKMNKIGYKILLGLIYSLDKNIKIIDVDINFKTRSTGYSKMSLKILFILIYVIILKFFRL